MTIAQRCNSVIIAILIQLQDGRNECRVHFSVNMAPNVMHSLQMMHMCVICKRVRCTHCTHGSQTHCNVVSSFCRPEPHAIRPPPLNSNPRADADAKSPSPSKCDELPTLNKFMYVCCVYL